MLKYGLKIDRVHTYKDLCLSQMEEKITWVIEMTTGSPLNCAQLQEQLALVVIVNIGFMAFFWETENWQKDYCFDNVNEYYKCRPQNFPTAIDSTNPWKNYMQVKEDRHKV